MTANVPTLTLQQLIDAAWINPFALQLLVESWDKSPFKERVTFDFRGCRITLEQTPPFDGVTPRASEHAGYKAPPPPPPNLPGW